jgi:hypothetical protein
MAMGNGYFFCSLYRIHYGKRYLQPRSLFDSYVVNRIQKPGKERQLIIPQGDSPGMGGSHSGHRYVGHTHFWERALYSRRQFVKTSMGVTGAVLGSELWLPGLAQAHTASVAPKPIPGGFQPLGPGTELFHVFLIEHGAEISTITDFHGSIGGAEIQGTGTATHTNTGKKEALLFDVDMRFMKGVYVGVDGEKHRGTFGFI